MSVCVCVTPFQFCVNNGFEGFPMVLLAIKVEVSRTVWKLPEPSMSFYNLPETSRSFCKLPWVQWIITRSLNTKVTTNYAQRFANNWSCFTLLLTLL